MKKGLFYYCSFVTYTNNPRRTAWIVLCVINKKYGYKYDQILNYTDCSYGERKHREEICTPKFSTSR